jgi:hypothetical protein
MNFREQLELLDDQTIVALGNHELIDFIRIDILLEQTWDYYSYFINLFDVEWDGDDSEESELIVLYSILRSRFEQFSEDRLYDVFELYADRDLVLRELMYLDKEARQNLLDSL